MTSTLPIRVPRESKASGDSRGEGSAHAKAILFGEHAVVYGAPAIAVPIHELEAKARVESAAQGLRIESELFSGDAVTAPESLLPVITAVKASLAHVNKLDATLKVQILSAIPHSRGLGSSAAVAAAVARAVANWAGVSLDTAALYGIVQQAERVAHGNPSGLDARAVTASGTIRFDFGAVSPVRVGAPLSFVLADTGIAGSTAEAVGGVRARRDQNPAHMDELLSNLATVAESAVSDLAAGDKQLIGARMREAHALLDAIGVSSPALNSLVASAHEAGAHGAKLTGGGLGGCIIALAESAEHAEELGSALRAAGAPRTWTSTVPAS